MSETPFPPTQVLRDAEYFEAKYRLTARYAEKLEALLEAANEKLYRLEGPKDFVEDLAGLEQEYLASIENLEMARRDVAEVQQEEKRIEKER